MTKVQLIEEINTNLNSIETALEQDLMSNQRNGIDEKYEVGEYSFFESEYQEDYDMFTEDMTESLSAECDYQGGIQFCTWSSKSGTSVFVDAFRENEDLIWDFESEWGFTQNDTEVEEFTYIELMDIYKDSKILNKEVTKERAEYDEQLVKITDIIDSMAEGKKIGCFSNGEVVFSSTDADKEDYTTQYNQNEEVT